MGVELHLGDCLDVMRGMADNSVDAVVTDPPYGSTCCEWDTDINLGLLWGHINRVLTDTGTAAIFANHPFGARLIVANLSGYRYSWVWKKTRAVNFLQAKAMPMKYHEDIHVFSKGTANHLSRDDRRMTYNPQMRDGEPYRKTNTDAGITGVVASASLHAGYTKVNEGTRYPSTVLAYPNGNRNSLHPTQKPVDLITYLVLTHTDPGDTVLDPFMGSGTTGVACVQTGRNFIGVEIDPTYYAIAEKRIAEAQMQPALMEAAE